MNNEEKIYHFKYIMRENGVSTIDTIAYCTDKGKEYAYQFIKKDLQDTYIYANFQSIKFLYATDEKGKIL